MASSFETLGIEKFSEKNTKQHPNHCISIGGEVMQLELYYFTFESVYTLQSLETFQVLL